MRNIICFGIIVLLSSVSFCYADTELSLSVTASYSYSSNPASNTVDNNLSTYWRGRYHADPWWLRFDCGNSYNLSQISIWWDSRYGARDYDIQSSQDGNTWTNIYTGLTSGASNPRTFTLSVTARFIRIYIKQEARLYPRIYEVKIYTAGAANQPPTAQASANPTQGTAPLAVQFNGSGQDSDGTITGYNWNFGDGSSSIQQNPLHTYNLAGNYTATLTVTDNSGATGVDSVTISVIQPANQSPTAQAFANPAQGEVPLDAQFTGSGQDPDGTIVDYSWDFGDGQVAYEQNPLHTYQNIATYQATLTVTDDDGATGQDSVAINVYAPANQPPTAQVAADITQGDVPLQVNFTGSGQDPDGTIVGYSWDFGDGNTSTEQDPTHTYDTIGNYTAKLTVTDNDGATASTSINIQVNQGAGPAIPQLIRFQARLEDANKVPLEGTYTVTFRIYDTDLGGSPLWQEIQSVDVTEGILEAKLGSVTTLDLPFDKPYWLGIEVENDGEMSPRFDFTTVPYAFKVAP